MGRISTRNPIFDTPVLGIPGTVPVTGVIVGSGSDMNGEGGPGMAVGGRAVGDRAVGIIGVLVGGSGADVAVAVATCAGKASVVKMT
jgi:hypothetical protein